jgi:ABC-type Mn2+/Zn2+ transport system permease subunit
MNEIISAFFDSWKYFDKMYIAGWLIALPLAQLGCLVVARNQTFVGAAVAQASAGGVAVAIWCSAILHLGWFDHGGHDDDHPAQTAAAILSAVLASVLALLRGRAGDTATSWLFLIGTTLPILLLSNLPHGVEEVNQLFGSSIIGVSWVDVRIFAVQAAVVAVALALWRRRVCLVVLDPAFALAVGIPAAGWSIGIALALGIALGLSIASSGTLFAFGCLVLPALIARGWCRTLGALFLAAPAIALLCAVVGFVLANAWNLPPGHAAVAMLGIVLVLSAVLRALIALGGRLLRREAIPRPVEESLPGAGGSG